MAGHGHRHGNSTAQLGSRGKSLSLNAAQEEEREILQLFLQSSLNQTESPAPHWGAGLQCRQLQSW